MHQTKRPKRRLQLQKLRFDLQIHGGIIQAREFVGGAHKQHDLRAPLWLMRGRNPLHHSAFADRYSLFAALNQLLNLLARLLVLQDLTGFLRSRRIGHLQDPLARRELCFRRTGHAYLSLNHARPDRFLKPVRSTKVISTLPSPPAIPRFRFHSCPPMKSGNTNLPLDGLHQIPRHCPRTTLSPQRQTSQTWRGRP